MEILDYLELVSIEGLGNITLKKLIEKFKTPRNIFESSFNEISSVANKSVAEAILKRNTNHRKFAEREYSKANKLGIKIIHINDNLYPELLKEIPDPPIVLYYLGDITRVKNCISIVGSRKYTSYGKSITLRLSKDLANEGLNIVSGMASGIDSFAHIGALSVNGLTTAVLGSGVDIIYPYENKKIYEYIKENGCIISELLIGTRPSKYTFPRRNRIIAGLSYGTIITEASEKSGALITVKYALDYNRIVFSVPTNITNQLGRGNNLLLKEGAYPLTEIEDIFKEIPFLKSSKVDRLDNNSIDLSEKEKLILKSIYKPTHIDELVSLTGIEYTELIELIFEMELKDLIINENGFITGKFIYKSS